MPLYSPIVIGSNTTTTFMFITIIITVSFIVGLTIQVKMVAIVSSVS